MKQCQPTNAPALIRGIRILRLLEAESPLTLEMVAARTGIPKASAMRLLHTLRELGLAERDPVSKSYTPRARLVPITGTAARRRHVQDALRRLAEQSGHTAEWYVPAEQGVILVQRREPEAQQVHVVARIGFVRPWYGELDAVACEAWAHAERRPEAAEAFWVYDGSGEHRSLTPGQLARRLTHAREAGYSGDEHYNTNGVRRVAAAVLRDGALSGVLALAGSYRPGNGDHLEQAAVLLRHESVQLGELMNMD